MARPLLPDAPWQIVEPLLPKHPPRPNGGRPRSADRKALTGALFVLQTGLPSEDRPAETNGGCGLSCWRRLAEWQADGTWDEVHALLLERLPNAGELDWSKGVIGSSGVRAVFGGSIPGRTPRIEGRRAASTT